MASCAASKALALHGFDKVVEGAAIGASGVGPGGIDLHSHRVSSRSSGLGAWGVASGSAIADGVVPSTSQVDEFLQGGGFLGEFCNAQPLMYGVGEAIPSDAVAAFTQPEPDATIGNDGVVTLTATYDPAAQENLTEATISYAVYENDGTVSYFGEEAADLGTADS